MSRVPVGIRHCSIVQTVQTGSAARPLPIQWVATGVLCRVRRQGPEAGHSPASSAEVENQWSYTSTPPVCLHGVDRDSLTFTFTFSLFNIYRRCWRVSGEQFEMATCGPKRLLHIEYGWGGRQPA